MRKNFEKKTSHSPNMINGNSIDVVVNKCDSEIKADIIVSEINSIRLWGQVKNCHGTPVPNVLLKLVRVTKTCSGYKYDGIAHTISDCNGFYQFDVCYTPSGVCYKVIASKASIGPERIITSTNCEPCYNPCSSITHCNCNCSSDCFICDFIDDSIDDCIDDCNCDEYYNYCCDDFINETCITPKNNGCIKYRKYPNKNRCICYCKNSNYSSPNAHC